MSDCACSRGCLLSQVVVQQPDQHDRQRDVYRTDGACFSVRRGAVGGLFCLLSLDLASWRFHGCWGLFFQGCYEAFFLVKKTNSRHFLL